LNELIQNERTNEMIGKSATSALLMMACPALAAGAEAAAKPGEAAQPAAAAFVPDTPAWPENPPATWPIYRGFPPGK